MPNIVETSSLSKEYDKTYVVDSINMHIKKGEIYALVGKNGAGKTTVMKMITGLVEPSNGSIKLFQSPNLDMERHRIGSIIEAPAFYGNLTAEENLRLMKTLCDNTSKHDIDALWSIVGLEDSRRKKVKNYSLGMKQRLGIAMALVGSPELLILDEPINGLDPVGIKEIQRMLLHLNKDFGTTILISSHILGELYKVAARYGVMASGKLTQEISFDEWKFQNPMSNQSDFESYLIGLMEG